MPSSYGYAAAVESLYALGAELAPGPGQAAPRRKFDLEHMRRLVAALGHPERQFPAVLIAGTNGKGSTSATLASILQAAGYKTGLYTSPHLINVNERIRINGKSVTDDEFVRLYDQIGTVANDLVTKGELPQPPSFFETLTAMGFEYFADSRVDIAVLEVGLGGRLDATNVVEPLISVITDIALDHQQWLGDTLTEIAREKAGILRPAGTAVLLPQHPEANTAIGEVAMGLDARAVSASDMLPDMSPEGGNPADYELQWGGETISVCSPLLGRHQWRNIALALKAAEELKSSFNFDKITGTSVSCGVRTTRWPGRFQRVWSNGHNYVFDVAHNPAGAWALRSALSQYEDQQRLVIVFGAMQDKRIDEIASILFPVADSVVLTRAKSPRAAMPEQIATQAAHTGAEFALTSDVAAALSSAEGLCPQGGTIVVTGSVFVVGEALAILAPESVV